jgi:Type IV secretion system proteins
MPDQPLCSIFLKTNGRIGHQTRTLIMSHPSGHSFTDALRMALSVAAALAAVAVSAINAHADIPVIDKATLKQATEIAEHTREIMESNQDIQEQTQKILEAVSGTRSDAQGIADAALGGGFNFGQAPSMAEVLGGGILAFGSMPPEVQKAAAVMINGLNLVKSLSGLTDAGERSSNEAAYSSSVSAAAMLASLIAGTQSSQSQRAQAFQGIGSEIGQTQDIKGSIDQNSQIGLQHALTTNEMIGVVNALNGAEQAKLMKRLAEESGTADLMRYDPKSASRKPVTPLQGVVDGSETTRPRFAAAGN